MPDSLPHLIIDCIVDSPFGHLRLLQRWTSTICCHLYVPTWIWSGEPFFFPALVLVLLPPNTWDHLVKWSSSREIDRCAWEVKMKGIFFPQLVFSKSESLVRLV
jgi:hypothetical protein